MALARHNIAVSDGNILVEKKLYLEKPPIPVQLANPTKMNNRIGKRADIVHTFISALFGYGT